MRSWRGHRPDRRRLVLLALAEGGDQLRSLGAEGFTTDALLLHERFGVLTVLRTAFGRAIAELGAAMIEGGHKDGVTRVMITTVALESSKGDPPRAARAAVAGRLQSRDLVPEGRAPRGTMVFQRPFVRRLSVRRNLLLGLWLRGVPAEQQEPLCRQALQRVGLASLAGRRARELSGGPQQRLALARAWALQPDILFLDEPTVSLNPGAKREIEALVQDFAAAGVTLVISTHNLGQARRLATRTAYLEAGTPVVDRAAEDLHSGADAPDPARQFVKGELPWPI